MHSYTQIYEFAASAGAFEGYVYKRNDLDMKALPIWLENLKMGYSLIPPEVLEEIQPSIDRTLGRAYRSVAQTIGEDHPLVVKLSTMIKGTVPGSPDEFNKEKWFQTGARVGDRKEG